jgi:hypothetical protein
LVAILSSLKDTLHAVYPDCAPLRKELNRIDMPVKLVGRMKPIQS